MTSGPGTIFIKEMSTPSPVDDYSEFLKIIIKRSKKDNPTNVEKVSELLTTNNTQFYMTSYRSNKEQVSIALIPISKTKYLFLYYNDLEAKFKLKLLSKLVKKVIIKPND
jgi:hypothetical protein